MNLFSAICLAVAAGVTVDLVRKLTGWTILGMVAGIGLALTPIAWAIATHAEAHSLHLALLAILLWLLVTWDERRRRATALSRDHRGDARDPPRPLPRRLAAIVSGWRSATTRSRLLLAVPVGLYVLAVDPGIWRRGRLVLGVRRRPGADGRPRLSRAAAPGRAVPRRAGVRHPEHPGRLPLHRPRRAVPGQPVRPVRRAAEEGRRARDADVAQFGILAPLIPVGFVVTALRRPRYALLTGSRWPSPASSTPHTSTPTSTATTSDRS